MSGQNRAGISQCMIVKNEEKNIERALSWGKGIVSEQIVVDTGSTDRTVEIARRMGAKVYHFEWIDDFAAAKNYAISKADYDWIAFLDADEYFSSEDAEKIRCYVERIQDRYDCIISALIELDNNGKVLMVNSQIRIFRNLPVIRYRGRIHEYLERTDGRNMSCVDAVNELSLYHTGYGARENQEKKADGRNLRLIRAELAEHPEDWRMWGYLGNEYSATGEFAQAEEAYRKAAALIPEKLETYDSRAADIFSRLLDLLAFRTKAEQSEVMKVYEQAVRCRPQEADFDYVLGRYFASKGDYRGAQEHLKRALGLLETYGHTEKAAMLSADLTGTYELLAACCYNNGELAECVKLTTMLLKTEPYLMSTAMLYLSAFCKDPGTAARGEEAALEIIEFLGSTLYDLSTLKDRLFLLRAAMSAGYEELVTVLRRMFAPEELKAVEQSLGLSSREKKRIALFYSGTESFNFFTDRLAEEFRGRGHEVAILDIYGSSGQNSASYEEFNRFFSRGLDAAVCFDGFGTREEEFIREWDAHQVTVVNILMDPPFRFHPSLERHAQNYRLFCCDLEHVEYVKKYFGREVPCAAFMPHVGVMPDRNAPVIPYRDRKYDILFSGTYYCPEDMLGKSRELYPDNEEMLRFYERAFERLKNETDLTIEQAVVGTLERSGMAPSEEELKRILNRSLYLDWAIRMYVRGQAVTALAEAGLKLHLLGRGWENHPASALANVHRIDDRIPYGETLSYMADAKINLNVMPWFKAGTHDRIFNSLLQHSVPLTDPSLWLEENFTDGVDIAFYDLKHLDRLPDIAGRLLADTELAEHIIRNGYTKVSQNLTWSHCADWILESI